MFECFIGNQSSAFIGENTIINMKIALIFAIFAIAAAAADTHKIIPVLERTETHDDKGFTLTYLTGDGTVVREEGVLKPTPDGKGYFLVKEGEYTYSAPTGEIIKTRYIADHLGFRAVGDHLPKSVVALA